MNFRNYKRDIAMILESVALVTFWVFTMLAIVARFA